MDGRLEHLPFEGLSNARDLGGFMGKAGKHTQYQKMLRSDNLSRITAQDIRALMEVYHLRYVIDLRGNHEINPAEDKPIPGVKHLSLPIRIEHDGDLPHNPKTPVFNVDDRLMRTIEYLYKIDTNGDCSKAMEAVYRQSVNSAQAIHCWREFFLLALDHKEGSMLFHCASGKDRTGVAAMLFLKALGVEDRDIIQDYLESEICFQARKSQRREYLLNHGVTDEKLISSVLMLSGVQENWIRAAIDEVDTRFGGIHRYWKNALGLNEIELDQLSSLYLE